MIRSTALFCSRPPRGPGGDSLIGSEAARGDALNATLARPPVVFDLDGTLVDSRRDLATAIDALRGELGLPPLGLPAVVRMVGEGARVLVERALADAAGRGVAVDVGAALARFLDLYDAVCRATTVPYPGIPELLAELAADRPLGLLTNKPVRMTTAILAHLDLARHFRGVIGGDSLPSRKPDPAGLALLADRFGAPLAALTLVGDSLVDVATAGAAGCRLLLVGWGFVAPEVLAGASAAPLAADVGALRRLLVAPEPGQG